MSAVRWLREFGALALSLFGSVLGWLLLAPLASLIPRRHDWIAVIGRQHGKFLDNAKYFFLQGSLQEPGLRLVFITERPDVVSLLETTDAEVLLYPGPAAIWYLLRCGSVVVDSTDWNRHLRGFLLLRARTLQLWHGVAFKRIELDKWRNETGRYRWFSRPRVFRLRILAYRLTGRLPRYDAVNSTSRFYSDQVFKPAFLSRYFLVSGYPRNTFGRIENLNRPLLWSNVDKSMESKLNDWSISGHRLVAVAPTMRDSGVTAMQMDRSTMQMLDDFCAEQSIELIFKFHPSDQSARRISGRHLHVCAPDSDLYPLLPFTAALITDYSSIYMDYLLLDKPVLFLIPDDDDYAGNDRQMQFDLAKMTPGPKCSSWQEITVALSRQWQQDSYAEERVRLRRMAFDDLPQEQAVPELLGFMREQGWLREGK